MSDHSLKRLFLLASSSLLVAATLLANEPGARYESAFVYNEKTTHSTLFGGLTGNDAATKLAYELGDTWDFNGVRWTELYPAHSPSARAAHGMVYDPVRSRIVLFGGRTNHSQLDLNDTWSFNGFDWQQINTVNAPSPRSYSALAYDAVRNRIVLYGGAHLESDGKTITTYHDTWEFDGTDWTKVGDNGPDLQKPKIAYDVATSQMVMLGADSSFNAHMYLYDPAATTWNEQKPTNMPPCVSGASLVYVPDAKIVITTGGICSSPPATEDVYGWDGTNWNTVAATNTPGRLFDAAATYDTSRSTFMVFGGVSAFSIVTSVVPIADLNSLVGGLWFPIVDGATPVRRSLPAFVSDPDHNNIWVFSGVNEAAVLSDFRSLQYNKSTAEDVVGSPSTCSPNGAYDTDRHKLVIVCSDSSTFEWDGSLWMQATPKDLPPARRFSSMIYDQNIHKTVLLGGYDGTNYLNETWLWDGTNWVRQSNNPPTYRSLAQMWFDPKMNRTVIYGGIGRQTTTDRVTRFDDMWTFDGNGWTQIKAPPSDGSPTVGTPGMRYGAEIAVDPRTKTALLFGGIRTDNVNVPPPANPNGTPIATQVQVYANDWWEWDGATQTWTQITFTNSPPARENAGFAWDPSLQTMVMYAGWAGTFYSDLWTMSSDRTTWRPVSTGVVRVRPSR